jgi:hypothetical protein
MHFGENKREKQNVRKYLYSKHEENYEEKSERKIKFERIPQTKVCVECLKIK